MKKTKTENLFCLIEKLVSGKEIYATDRSLQGELGVDRRTLERYIKELEEQFGNRLSITKEEKNGSKITVIRASNPDQQLSKIVAFFLEKESELGWLLQLLYENQKPLIERSAYKDMLAKVFRREKETILFVNPPFENLADQKQNEIFAKLRTAIQHNEYREIEYSYTGDEVLTAKCIKLIHMQNNWYCAVEAEGLRLLRLSFIRSVNYAKDRSSFQKSSVAKYDNYFTKIQNAMTLDQPFETALLKADKEIAIYFAEHMKPFFATQKFLSHKPDGSILFTVGFTQPIEILPFIKNWLPYIEIIEPKSLRDSYEDDLKKALEKIQNDKI